MLSTVDLVSNLKAIIFDMDGVLINSMPFHAVAWRKAFEYYDIEVDAEIFFEMEGMNQKRTIEEILDMKGEESKKELIDGIGRKKTEFTDERLKMKPFKKVIHTLPKLGSRYKLAVVSGSTRHFVEEVINKHFQNCFDVIVSAQDTDENKPSPDPYLNALEKLNTSKENILVVENAPLGVESAKRAGLICVAVSTYLSGDKLQGADLVLNNCRDLVDFLEKGL